MAELLVQHFLSKGELGPWTISFNLPEHPSGQAVFHQSKPQVRKGPERVNDVPSTVNSCVPATTALLMSFYQAHPHKMEVTYWTLDPHTHLETARSSGFIYCPWPLSQISKLAPFHDFLFSKTHDESHVLSPCLKTQQAQTNPLKYLFLNLNCHLAPRQWWRWPRQEPGGWFQWSPEILFPPHKGFCCSSESYSASEIENSLAFILRSPLFLPGTAVQVE